MPHERGEAAQLFHFAKNAIRSVIADNRFLEPVLMFENLGKGGLAPRDGFEPPAKRLTVACSTAELPGKSLSRFYT